MDTPSDSTRVLRMKEDFDFFLSKSTANRGANQSQSGWSQASVATKLSFDNSQMEAETSTGQNKSSLVMADVMGKSFNVNFNPFNVEATFVQSTRTKSFLITI